MKTLLKIIPYACALMFAYAGATKLIEHEKFLVQLGQSPMLLDFAELIAWFIPVTELIIAVMLLWPTQKIKLAGVYGFITLMTIFCFYIIAILNFEEHIPCACGGILGELESWSGHLVFNVLFILLAVVYIFWLVSQMGYSKTVLVLGIFIALAFANLVVVFLYLRVDKHPNYRHDSFIRNYREAAVNPAAVMNLKRADYYFAGKDTNWFYLANQMAFDRLLKIDQDLKDSIWLKLRLPKFRYRSIKVIVEPPYFYLSDGSGSTLYSGSLTDLKGSVYLQNTWYFNAVPLTSGSVALLSMRDRQNKLAKKTSPTAPEVFYNDLLKEQGGEGMFSTSGKLMYEPLKQRLLYLYHYRNEYLVIDTAFNLIHTGKTIDTVSQAKLKIGSLNDNKEFILQQSLLVNKGSCVYGDKIYVNSNLLAKNESIESFEKSTAIDVYNYKERHYLYSVSIPEYRGQKVREFIITGDNELMALQGNYLVKYHLPNEP